ncbi:autotransporter outer membrane beta-barrel domain-containing protein [Limnobaculum parvum]|nr:autotransporter outer membrane beta-barrel domain-containing protein [Limnobaculum parvum]
MSLPAFANITYNNITLNEPLYWTPLRDNDSLGINSSSLLHTGSEGSLTVVGPMTGGSITIDKSSFADNINMKQSYSNINFSMTDSTIDSLEFLELVTGSTINLTNVESNGNDSAIRLGNINNSNNTINIKNFNKAFLIDLEGSNSKINIEDTKILSGLSLFGENNTLNFKNSEILFNISLNGNNNTYNFDNLISSDRIPKTLIVLGGNSLENNNNTATLSNTILNTSNESSFDVLYFNKSGSNNTFNIINSTFHDDNPVTANDSALIVVSGASSAHNNVTNSTINTGNGYIFLDLTPQGGNAFIASNSTLTGAIMAEADQTSTIGLSSNSIWNLTGEKSVGNRLHIDDSQVNIGSSTLIANILKTNNSKINLGNAGTLTVNSDTDFVTSQVTMADNSLLNVNGYITLDNATLTTGAGSKIASNTLNIINGSNLTLNSQSTLTSSGGITLNSGTLNVLSGNSLNTSDVALAANSNLNLTGATLETSGSTSLNNSAFTATSGSTLNTMALALAENSKLNLTGSVLNTQGNLNLNNSGLSAQSGSTLNIADLALAENSKLNLTGSVLNTQGNLNLNNSGLSAQSGSTLSIADLAMAANSRLSLNASTLSSTGNIALDSSLFTMDSGSHLTTNDVTLTNNATLLMLRTSDVTAKSIQLNNGNLAIGNGQVTTESLSTGGGEASSQITPQALSVSNARIRINVDGHLTANSATGTYNTTIASIGSIGQYDGREMITTNGGGAIFDDGDGYDLGIFRYDLVQQGNSWYLQERKHDLSSSARAVASLSQASLTSWNAETDSVHQRMTVSRRDNDQGSAWGSYLGAHTSTQLSNGEKASQSVNGFSLGVDKRLNTDLGSYLLGVAVSRGISNIDHMINSSYGNSHDVNMQAYTSYSNPLGFFLDGLVSYSVINSKITTVSLDDEHSDGSLDTHGFGASLKGGYHYVLPNTAFIEPYVRASMLNIADKSYSLDNGLRVTNNQYKSLQGELGVDIGKTFALGDSMEQTLRPYVKVAYQQEFKDNNTIDVNNYTISNNIDGSGGKVGTGLEYTIKRNFGAYVTANYGSKTGDTGTDTHLTGTAGLRYNW